MLFYIKHFFFFGGKLIATSLLGWKFLLASLISVILFITYSRWQILGDLKVDNTNGFKKEEFTKFYLKTPSENYLNSLWICIYFVIFILGILILRLMNVEKQLDLKPLISQWIHFFTHAGWIEIIINLYLLILILYCLYKILKKIFVFFQKQLLKRHIFFMRFDTYCKSTIYSSWFLKYNFYQFLYILYIRYQRPFLRYFYEEVFEIKDFLPGNEPFFEKLRFYTFYYLHYFILLFLIYLDLRYNNLILTKIYIFLPFFFVYFFWIKISVFYKSKIYEFDRFLSLVYYTKAQIIPDRKNRFYPTYFFPFNFETYEWCDDQIPQLHEYIARNLVSPEFKIYGSI